MANVENPPHLGVELFEIVEIRALPVERVTRRCLRAAFFHGAYSGACGRNCHSRRTEGAGSGMGPAASPHPVRASWPERDISAEAVQRFLKTAGMAFFSLGKRLEPLGNLVEA